MTSKDAIYRQLQQHLDQQAVGFPATWSGADIRFLKRLFSPEEAKLARHLSYRPTPLEAIAQKSAAEFSAEQVTRLLNSMLMKGAIGRREKREVSHWFVMPLIIGMYEAQDGSPTAEFLADADAYMKTLGFGRSFLSVKPSQMRTIPINKSIPVEHPVATYDHIRAIIQAAPGPFVVLKCICREHRSMDGEPCRKTSRPETCLAMNDAAGMILRRTHGREVTRDEALAILLQNEEDGLVLQPANAQQPEFVCSCCGCCCGMLRLQKRLPHPIDFWTSNFLGEVTVDACVRCGKCVSRCQVKAVTLTAADGKASINRSRCIGCGLCVPTCPSHAIRLERKPDVIPPATDEELYEEIMANKKGYWGQLHVLLKTALGMRP